jgi:hypothetical protein
MKRLSLGMAAILFAASLFAGNKTDETRNQGLAAALRVETQGSAASFDRRGALASLRESSSAPQAWWQSGFVRVGDKWRPYDAAPEVDSELRKTYMVKRAAARPNAAEQLQLAAWCRTNGLREEERAHLVRALSTGQVHEPAKILHRLGYRQIGPWWFTDDELRAYAEETRAVLKEWKRLEPKLDRIAALLEGTAKQRRQGLEDLQALASPATIPVLERTLAQKSEPAASGVVEVLSGVESYRASQALARLAITSDWPSIRAAATEKLKQRPLEDFVPAALEMMSLPIETDDARQSSVTSLRRADIFHPRWRFVFAREGHTTIQASLLTVSDASGALINPPLFPANQQFLAAEFVARAAADAVHQRAEIADVLNDLAAVINQRAATLLSEVTEAPVRDDPAAWWHWWDHDIVDSELGKDVVIVSEEAFQVAPPVAPPIYQGHPGCLAAGTPVCTADGLVAIDKIQVGDRVLSKNVETGELAYKPVLHTTRREGAALSRIAVGGDEFEASPGHNFWISGRGWTRSNQLETGMPAHTVTGAVALKIEDAGRTADVFNLVVADFHTYFVGKSLILGHDVLQPAPTDAVVPGLTP